MRSLVLIVGIGWAALSAHAEEHPTTRPAATRPAATRPAATQPAGPGYDAIAILHPTGGSSVRGWVKFAKVEGGVRVTAEVEGLAPGRHGFHIHQFGDCSAPDGTSAGGHFNPTGAPHAGPDAPRRHDGDLGNLEADDEGRARYDRVDRVLRLDGDRSIIGRAVIVHTKADDLETQPTGDAGGRLACGVIGRR